MQGKLKVGRSAIVTLVIVLVIVLVIGACGSEPAPEQADAPAPMPDAAAAGPAVFCADPVVAPASGLDVLAALQQLPGVAGASESAAGLIGYRFFTFTFRQLVDHGAAGGATFTQRVTVLHRGASAPTVLGTQGYDLAQRPFREEPTILLTANQVEVEHRFFTPSRPDPVDWSKLTIWQAAADDHCLTLAMKTLYPGRWLDTGQSKGGLSAVLYRRFFPDDVDATIAYVAPLSLGAPDPRYVAAVETGSHPDCRLALRDFQRLAVGHRADVVAMMTSDLPGVTFDVLGVDEAFEHLVLELPFGFWQYGTSGDCANVPGPSATSADIFTYLEDVGQISLYGDGQIAHYGPYYEQAATQLGFPEIDESNLTGLLSHPGTDVAPSYVPAGAPTAYDPAPMRDLDAWVHTQGLRLLFVYGANDPWSAGMFELGDAVDSFRYVVADGNHGAQIGQLSTTDRNAARAALARWMDVAVTAIVTEPAKPERGARRKL